MRNARTLMERTVLSKAIEGELRTFDVDLHEVNERFEVYVYDPEEAFEAQPFVSGDFLKAKAIFDHCVALIMQESVSTTETLFDFAERVYHKLELFVEEEP